MKLPVFASLLIAITLVFLTQQSHAKSLLVSDSGGSLGYGYGYNEWYNITAALDAATENQITVVPNFENLNRILSFDALWLDQRWLSGFLSADEVDNISTFIATGRRVVMIGENSLSWADWNKQILGIVGGDIGLDAIGFTHSIMEHEITNLAPKVYLATAGTAAGTASGGNPLYDYNFATLWGDSLNVLTILDVNVMSDSLWGTVNNSQFSINVAEWVASGTPISEQVPEPTTLILIGVGLLVPLVIIIPNFCQSVQQFLSRLRPHKGRIPKEVGNRVSN